MHLLDLTPEELILRWLLLRRLGLIELSLVHHLSICLCGLWLLLVHHWLLLLCPSEVVLLKMLLLLLLLHQHIMVHKVLIMDLLLLLWLHLLLLHHHIRLATVQNLLLVLLLEHKLLLGPQIEWVLLISSCSILRSTLLWWSTCSSRIAKAWGCYSLAARRLVLETRG